MAMESSTYCHYIGRSKISVIAYAEIGLVTEPFSLQYQMSNH
jgi:hypothetical protein